MPCRPERTFVLAVALLWMLAQGVAGARQLNTTTTHYTYNADGELTAVATQVDDQVPTTTYLTWDDFAPNASDPATGTMSVGDGHLVSYGPVPGSGSQDAQFSFDQRDRLVGYANAQHSIVYDHHATGLMSSATADGADGWHFYYDDSQNPQVSNIYEPSTQRWSGYLGSARFVSDGGEQVLIEPRKDLVCEYDPRSQSVEAHTYDAYGTQKNATPAEGYDLSENPFQYAGEFRDPLWGGIYLRARWYDPDFPIFLSRDPMPEQLNHYGYAGGNPVTNTDPSGTHFGRKLDKITKGIGGHFARVLLSPFLGPLELAAHPKAFWKQLQADKGGIDIFLAAGVAAEGFGFFTPAAVDFLSLRTRFTVRLVTDGILGFGQSATQAALTKGSKHFNWHIFGQGAEYTVGGIGWTRGLAGIGYRPFGIKAADLESFVAKQGKLNAGEALIFRVQDRELTRYKGVSLKFTQTSPLQDARGLGLYHERLIAVTKEDVYSTEFFNREVLRENEEIEAGYFEDIRKENSTRYQFVGRKTNFSGQQFSTANPRGFATKEQVVRWKEALKTNKDTPFPGNRYSTLGNNCQDHVRAMLELLGMR